MRGHETWFRRELIIAFRDDRRVQVRFDDLAGPAVELRLNLVGDVPVLRLAEMASPIDPLTDPATGFHQRLEEIFHLD